jgi:hypothetical protein
MAWIRPRTSGVIALTPKDQFELLNARLVAQDPRVAIVDDAEGVIHVAGDGFLGLDHEAVQGGALLVEAPFEVTDCAHQKNVFKIVAHSFGLKSS